MHNAGEKDPDTSEILDTISDLLSVEETRALFDQLLVENVERRKELRGISRIIAILKKNDPFENLLQEIVLIISQAWQFPEHASAEIQYGDQIFSTPDFELTPWAQKQSFTVPGNITGIITICYTKEYPESDEGPFLKEERSLINNIAELISASAGNKRYGLLVAHHAERLKELDAINRTTQLITHGISIDETLQSICSLLPSSLQYPKIAVVRIKYADQEYTSGNFSVTPWALREDFSTIDNLPGSIEMYYLEKQPIADEGSFLKEERDLIHNVARLIEHFLNSHKGRELLAKEVRSKTTEVIGKHTLHPLQDPMSALAEDVIAPFSKHATIRYPVRNILLITTLYDGFVTHTNSRNSPQIAFLQCLSSPNITLAVSKTDALEKIRGRVFDAVIIVATTLPEEELSLARSILALHNRIPVYFFINPTQCDAMKVCARHSKGLFVWDQNPTLIAALGHLLEDELTLENYPILGNERIILIVEDSPIFASYLLLTLYQDLDQCEKPCEKPARPYVLLARNYEDAAYYTSKFSNAIVGIISDVEFEIHGSLEHGAGLDFIRLIKIHNPDLPCLLWSTDAENTGLAKEINALFVDKKLPIAAGTIRQFIDTCLQDPQVYPPAITLLPQEMHFLAPGSPGGKGHGISFLNALFSRPSAKKWIEPGIEIVIPYTVVIGTEPFAQAFDQIAPHLLLNTCLTDVRTTCMNIQFPDALVSHLKNVIDTVLTPLAVRSSSMQEDSALQPIAGLFETYIIPNSNPDPQVRLMQLESAIKMVYASLLFINASQGNFAHKNIRNTNAMAVVIQEVIGAQHGSYFYPTMSGVARSVNYYPVAHMKPEDGFAVIAFGLGVYVVEGRSGHRFSPCYPDVQYGSIKDLLNASQTQFYAVDTNCCEPDFIEQGEKAGLVLLSIEEAEQQGTLVHCASVYDSANDRMVPSLRQPGPRIVDFADILKYEYIPLAKTIDTIVKRLAETMGCPVEIEYALNLTHNPNKSAKIAILQVKPLMGNNTPYTLNEKEIDPEDYLLHSNSGLGNGALDTIVDVIIINTLQFNRLKTVEMAAEVDYFNRKLALSNLPYMLIGPGRWGTRDKSVGIPVSWSQINGARVIVETALDGFSLEASLGSHFFHNVTSMNVAYIAVENASAGEIHWSKFQQAQVIEEQTYFKHIRFEHALRVRIDGRTGRAIIARSKGGDRRYNM